MGVRPFLPSHYGLRVAKILALSASHYLTGFGTIQTMKRLPANTTQVTEGNLLISMFAPGLTAA